MKKALLWSILTITGTLLLLRMCSNRETHASTHTSYFNDSLPEITNNKKLRPYAMKIDSLYSRYQKRNGYNCCMLVAHNGEVILQKGYGFADYKSKTKIDSHTSFQLASVSKPITATAVMMLYEEGKIQLQDSVGKYIEGFPYTNITVDMLLCHRSGLPNYMYFCDTYVKDKTKLVYNEDIVRIVNTNKPKLSYKPGSHFMYSNTNYCLLASIVERVSEQSFSEFLKERIFTPLGMNDSYLVTDSIKKDDYARAYTYGFAPIKTDYLEGVVGDKGICSSVLDLYRFHLALENGTLLKKETLELAYEPRSNEKKGVKNYGYGWRMRCNPDDKIIYHNGWWKGFNNLFYRRMSDETVVIILSNKLNKAVYNINGLLGILGTKQNGFGEEEDNNLAATGASD